MTDKEVFEEVINAGNKNFYTYVNNLKTIDNGTYFKNFVKFLKKKQLKTKREKMKRNYDVLLNFLNI